MNPMNKSMIAGAGEVEAVAAKEKSSSPVPIGTSHFPAGVQFLLLYVFGRESLTLPICTFLFTVGVFCYTVVSFFMYNAELRAHYEDKGDQAGVDMAEALAYAYIPQIIYAVMMATEFAVNIKFGYWMASSRHLEMFAEKVSDWGVERETLFTDLNWVVLKVVPAMTVVVIMIPILISTIVTGELDYSDTSNDDDAPAPPTNQEYEIHVYT
jgi:hypothetical protein